MTLQPSMRGEATNVVAHENTAAAVGAGGVAVFGTPMLVALIENAAWQAVADALEEGMLTLPRLKDGEFFFPPGDLPVHPCE